MGTFGGVGGGVWTRGDGEDGGGVALHEGDHAPVRDADDLHRVVVTARDREGGVAELVGGVPHGIDPAHGGQIATLRVRRGLVLELAHHRDVVAEVLVVVHGGEVAADGGEEVAAVARQVVERESADGALQLGGRAALLADDRLRDDLLEEGGLQALEVGGGLLLGLANAPEVTLRGVHRGRHAVAGCAGRREL